jgi:NMD protein affecting ribosome stability and mRNA decay
MTKSGRQDRRIQERNHDPYKSKFKLVEPTVCPQCGAVYTDGRWQWADSVAFDANQATCQACRRIADHYPAGIVTLTGSFVPVHKDDILNLIRHLESMEKEQHPLNRIMNIEDGRGTIVVNTTDMHLARRIGDALRRAHKGDLEIRYAEETSFVRVNWRRDNDAKETRAVPRKNHVMRQRAVR